MHPRSKAPLYLLICILSLLTLTGCETPTGDKGKEEYTTSGSPEAYLAEAAELDSPARERKLVAAAELYYKQGDLKEAAAVLSPLNGERLPDPLFIHYTLLSGEVALAREHYLNARNILTGERFTAVIQTRPAGERLRWHLLDGELQALLGNDSGSIFAYTRAVPLLSERDRIREIHNNIWQSLSHFSDEELAANLTRSADDLTSGWYQLAQLVRKNQGDIAAQMETVMAWQRNNPSHPAAAILPDSLQQAMAFSENLPARVAVVLPKNADFKLASETIRDGMLAAYYQVLAKGGKVPEVKFYNSDSGDIQQLYQQVVSEGAEMVLGPLQREQIVGLKAAAALPVPVLALNYAEDGAPSPGNFYQFGLSIRDEAVQAAERAWIAGHRRAMTVTPRTGWGERALQAFREAWTKKGGSLVVTVDYGTDVNDYRPLLEPAFLVKHSQERADRLRRVLGKNIDYTPTRRGDLDMIFLIAYPQNGRQIKPTLDFLYAGDLPVYATSHIFDGSRSPGLNRDLDGITFTAMPWDVRGLSSGQLRPPRDLPSAYRNLFAMGVDAYRLHQWLPLLKALPQNEINGYTGRLSMGANNEVTRTQPWARFRDGLAVPAPSLTSDM